VPLRLAIMPDGHWLVMPQVSTVDDLFGTHRVGNRPPQPKDRMFTVCVFLLPAAEVDDLAQRQIAYDGKGVPIEELPASSSRLDCTTAVRPANS
jgi:hypothetical protein